MGIYIFIILPILGIVNRFWVEYCIIKIRCDMEFKDILKSIRKEKGMTQKDVYTLLNISVRGYIKQLSLIHNSEPTRRIRI